MKHQGIVIILLILSSMVLLEGCTQKNNLITIEPTEICYECFFKNMDPTLKPYLINFYSNFHIKDNYTKAEITYLLGRLTNNQSKVCESIKYYESAISEHKDALIIYESIFMLSNECEVNQADYLNKIINHSSGWKKEFYSNLKNNNLYVRIQPIKINKSLQVPNKVNKIILGASYIEVKNNSIIGVQTERTSRDWLSNVVNVYPNEFVDYHKIMPYHEGSRLKDILDSNLTINIVPLTATIVVKAHNKWWAPDEKGIFRFEVLADKIQYPTSKCYKNICLLEDTHGISMLVSQAIKTKSDLVIGCGDYTGKMEAAYYLSKKGIDVYFPADRFIGNILGYDGKGVLLGTAPIKGNIIGNQTIEIYPHELIIVQDISKPYPAQYYDSSKRYFKELEKYIDLNLDFVKVSDLNETYKITDKAKKQGSHIIAVRVLTKGDFEAVRNWLLENKNNRAVLFHSSLYPYAQPLFLEFPNQTSFGDPKPIFIE